MFNKMPSQDVGTWNTMILGYVKCEQAQNALELMLTNATYWKVCGKAL